MRLIGLQSFPFNSEQLNKAWRFAASQCHPDKPGGSLQKMQRVNEARAALKPLVTIVVEKPVEKVTKQRTNEPGTNNFLRQMRKQTIKGLKKKKAQGADTDDLLKFWQE